MAGLTRRISIAVLPALVVLAAPAVAGAVTNVNVQTIEGQPVVVAVNDNASSVVDVKVDVDTGDPGDPNDDTPFVAVQSNTGATAGSGCIATANPNIVGCEGTFAAVLVGGNGGNDRITMDLIADDVDPPGGIASGGDGDDEISTPPDGRVGITHPETLLEGDGGNDKIVGGNGVDELNGGTGNDTIDAHQGPDTVRGEAGNDTVSGGKEEPAPNAADRVDGGPGFDTIPNLVNDYDRLFDDDVSVTLDGQANDGEPGEGDNVTAVEKVNIVADHALFVGTDASEDVFVEANTSTIRGLGGNDRLVAYDGHDDLQGGAGNDFLQGGFGNDTLDGGAGVDQFLGDRTESGVFAVGNDTVRARDGNSEQIDCGIGGGDKVVADRSDVVSTTCESVDYGPFGVERFGPRTLVTLRLAAARIPARGPLRVRIANGNPFRVTGSVSGRTAAPVTVSVKRRVKLRTKRLSVDANSRKTVRMKLPAAMKRTLRRTGRLKLRLVVKVRDPAGTTRTVKKKVTAKLKR